MKILFVADNFPWPANGGGLMRISNALRSLGGLGEVELFALCDHRRTERDVPVRVTLSRCTTTPYPEAAPALRWRARWWLRSGSPMEVVRRQRDARPRAALAGWVDPPYDLVWFATLSTYVWLGRPRLGPTVVDLDDLEDVKELRRAALAPAAPGGSGALRWARSAVAAAQGRRNARDWTAVQRSVAGAVDRVVLSTEVDHIRCGFPNAVVVPNAFERPERPAGRLHDGEPTTLLLQGSLNYAPNMDAAEWLVEQVAPSIRALVPDVRIRLVGRPTPGVERLGRRPGVAVVGRVPDMVPELAGADVCVVPIRYGSGSRIKILEAFAHRVPVVSTTIGAEGLDVEDGVHLLLADDPASFARACQRVLVERDLRARLVDAAEERFLERYEWRVADEAIRSVVDGLADRSRQAD